jgi:hypothetical protein
VCLKIYARLQDPWGELESRLLLAQVALAKDDAGASKAVAECDRITVDEAEPRQHRHLTRAWLAQKESRWSDAALEIDRARGAFGDRARTGDHTPHLLARFAKMTWLGPALSKIDQWLAQIERAGADDAPASAKAE